MEKSGELLLSVIVPIYNVEKYLDRCMDSIVGQSYRNLEIIMVDDGSPDNCPAKCEEWAKRDNRIRVVHKQNGGLGYARNSGLEIATGDYVAFVDSDDYINPDMYEKLLKEAAEKDVDCVYCGFRQQLPSGEFIDVIQMDYTHLTGDEIKALSQRFIMDFSREHLNVGVWHGIYRRRLIDFKFVSEREYISEDMVFTHMFMRNCRSFSYIPEAFYNYIYNSGSLTKKYNEKTLRRTIASAALVNDIYKDTIYDNAGSPYAFCQIYYIMRFPMMRSKISTKERFDIFKNIINDPEYHRMLQHKEKFVFRNGLKFRFIKLVYYFQRKKMLRLNYVALKLISLTQK